MVIAVGSRIHWMPPYIVVFLDILPGRLEEVETNYVVVGLHQGSKGAGSGVVDGETREIRFAD